MKKIVPILLLLSPLAFASEYQIEKVVAPKGYILSKDLQAKECPNIWSKQIGLFMKNNSNVKNPNIISIGQELKVQNCQAHESEVVEKTELQEPLAVVEVAAKQHEPQEKKEESNFKFFVLGSYVNQQTERQDGDSRKHSQGYKIEIGKYFDVGEEKLKLSLGFSRINMTSHNKEIGVKEKRGNGFLNLDGSYLFQLSNKKIQLGPHLGLVHQPYEKSSAMRDFENRSDDSKLSAIAGGNLVYSLTDDWKIDLKMSNRIEGRLNLWSSIGLEYNF